MANTTLLTTGEVARHCQVTQRTVHNWIQAGHLTCARTPGGHQRVTVLDFQAFLRAHHLPVYGSGRELGGDRHPGSGLPRVLVVDDDETVRRVFTRYLESLGEFEISQAANGFNAGLEVGRFRPDVVTMDLMMPYMDGFEACRWIKEDPETRHVRILVVTGHDEEGYRERAMACGVDGWMPKPVELDQFGRKIAELVEIGRPL